MTKYTKEELREVDNVCLAIEKICGISKRPYGEPRKGFVDFMEKNYSDEIEEETKAQRN